MFGEAPRISRPDFPAGKRVLVISDIHGNLPYLKGLLEKAGFCRDDILILDGDFLEKGPDSIGTLHYIMELSREGNIYPILGNCDEWQLVFRWGKDGDKHMMHYLRKRRYGLIFEMLQQLGINPLTVENLSDHLPLLDRTYSAEWDFLRSLPHAIETDGFVFVHAGMDGSKPLEENTSDELTARDAFLREGQTFQKWVVTGHWPVVLYGENIVCANPIIDPGSSTHLFCRTYAARTPLPFPLCLMIPSRKRRFWSTRTKVRIPIIFAGETAMCRFSSGVTSSPAADISAPAMKWIF